MRLLIMGNSGSGKTTLARAVARDRGLSLLDLDEIVWSPAEPGRYRPDEEIVAVLGEFVERHAGWVIEGCYGRWVEHLLPDCTELWFLNPGLEACLRHCEARPWEPHKYPSQVEQDARLPMLRDWVRAYYAERTDDLSLAGHRRVFEAFAGPKREWTRPVEWPGIR